MAKIISIRPTGTTANPDPHILFTGDSASDSFTWQMTTSGLNIFKTSTPSSILQIRPGGQPLNFDGATLLTSTLVMGNTTVVDANGAWVGPGTNLKGNKGVKGNKGITGNKGIKGIKGPTAPGGGGGDKGPIGNKGIKGPTGPTGPASDGGDTGGTGASPQGSKGIQGNSDKGPKGLVGPSPQGGQGTKGNKGIK